MKKFITLLVLSFLLSCAPMAEYVKYDVFDHYPIYGLDGMKFMPPHDAELSEGESYVWYLGDIKRHYRRKGITYIEIEKNNYVYTETIQRKIDLRNGSKCFILRINVDGKIRKYLISELKKYMVYEG